MKDFKKKLIKLHYKNNSLFNKLSDDRKELLYEKYSLVYSILPIDAKLFYKRRIAVNTGILDLVSNNMASCISGAYIMFIYRELYFPRLDLDNQYKNYFDFSNFSKECIPDKLRYFFEFPRFNDCVDQDSINYYKMAGEIRDSIWYREFGDKKTKGFYCDLLPYIASYFIMDEELSKNVDLFVNLLDYLAINIDEIYSYYLTNFSKHWNNNNPLAYFPHYLYEKYKEGTNKKEIL